MFNCEVVGKQPVVVDGCNLLPGGLVDYVVVVSVFENQVPLFKSVLGHSAAREVDIRNSGSSFRVFGGNGSLVLSGRQ